MATTVADAPLSWPGRLLLAAFGAVLALGTGEAALRIARFHFDLIPTLEFGWPDPVTLHKAYAPDPDLVWVRRDYATMLENARTLKPAVVYMGDSCTEFSNYASKTAAALEQAGSPLARGVKLGIGGFTSAQGLEQLRRDVIPLHPRVVTIYYGWNDHWVARGLTDPEIERAEHLRTLAEHLRLAQVWLKLEVAIAAQRRPLPNRVPVHDYEANLVHMANDARAAGITPVFITAPSNHVAGHEPPYLAKRHVRSLSELVPLHASYVDATKRAAASTGAALCDAAAAFAALPGPHDPYFLPDGIHLTEIGSTEMASILSGCLRRLP